MNAEILTIGAELLAGDTVDSNSRHLTHALRGLGISITRQITVGDEIPVIAEVVGDAMARADVVAVTGGLGPTPDDVTREGVAEALGLKLKIRQDLLEELEAGFRSFGYREMPPSNVGQITLPKGAAALANPLGTAPGFRIEKDGSVLFAVPGVPVEMKRMVKDHVLPWLRENRPVVTLASRTLRTMGIGESDLVTRFGPVLDGLKGVEVGFYPQTPGVNLKFSVRADTREEANRILDRAENVVREAMGSRVYGGTEATLAGVVGELLVAKGWTVATAESCTGGRLAGYLTSVSGASRYFDRSVVAYADRAKEELLGVPRELIQRHGAVSEEVARAMAEGFREKSGVDVVVAVTGIAGPTGGSEEKPVGLVFTAVAAPDGTRSWRSRSSGTRDLVVERTVMAAANRLRLVLLGEH